MDYSKKEKMIYTLILCLVMEFFMAFYNNFFHTDAFLDEAFLLACVEFVPAFLCGFFCEWFLISKPAKKLAYFLHQNHFQDHNIIHINEFLIAIGMMIVISLFGACYHADHETISGFFQLVVVDFFKNAVVGIPLFMLLVSPLARKIVQWLFHEDRDSLLLS